MYVQLDFKFRSENKLIENNKVKKLSNLLNNKCCIMRNIGIILKISEGSP